VKKIEISQHSKYVCPFCGKNTVKRKAVGIWDCKSCKKRMAGGAYVLSTAAAADVRTTLTRVKRNAQIA
jgi:large subunit ribosomal protein L37Ae